MTISKEVLDELLSGVENANDLLGDQGLMKELKVRLMERMLGAELTEHLGYEPGATPAIEQGNRRNGSARKTVKGNDGALPIDVPRDRAGSFEPELIKKGQTRIDGMDDKIIGLYAAGLSTRDIRAHLEEVYGLKVSADLVSRVTDAVLEEVSDWQNRALEPMYPIVFLDAALLHKGWVRDSSRESSVVAGLHEQTHPAELQDQELAVLQRSAEAARLPDDLVRPRDGLGAATNGQAWTAAAV